MARSKGGKSKVRWATDPDVGFMHTLFTVSVPKDHFKRSMAVFILEDVLDVKTH